MLGLIIVVILAIDKANTLSRRVDSLEEEVHRLRDIEGLDAPSLTRPAASPGSPPSPAQAPPPPPPSMPTPKTARPGVPLRTRSRSEWEMLIGGKVLNRIGALALILGGGFFLKYAFDNAWITETVRVILGGVTGTTLLAAASVFRKKGLEVFSQGLVGAGLSILYLSVYAACNFYHLLPMPNAFILMSSVTALTIVHALRYDSFAILMLGWAGGFLTPFLLQTHVPNEIGLFSYIALLDLGLLTVLAKRDRWAILEPLTLGATYTIYIAWYERYYTPDDLYRTLFFLSLFWSLFYALDLARIAASKGTFPRIRHTVGALNAALYTQGLYALINDAHPDRMGSVILSLGIVYALTAILTRRFARQTSQEMVRHLLTAIVFLVLATAIEYDAFKAVLLWSLEGLLIFWAGLRSAQPLVWQSAGALFALAGLKLLFTEGALAYSPITEFTLFSNVRCLTFLVLAGSSAGAANLLRKTTDHSKRMTLWLYAGALVVLVIVSTVEVRDLFERGLFWLRQGPRLRETVEAIQRLTNIKALAISGVWLSWSILLITAGIWKRLQGVRIAAILLFGLTILKIFLFDLSFLSTLYRMVAMMALGIVLLAVSYFYQKHKAIFS